MQSNHHTNHTTEVLKEALKAFITQSDHPTIKLKNILTEQSSIELKNDFAEETIKVIDSYLESKWSRYHNHSMSSDILRSFLDDEWDHQYKVYQNKSACQDLLVLMANPEIQKLGFVRTKEAAEALQRVISLCEALTEEERQADLDRQYISTYGGEQIKVIKNMYNEYKHKLQVEEFKNKLEQELE